MREGGVRVVWWCEERCTWGQDGGGIVKEVGSGWWWCERRWGQGGGGVREGGVRVVWWCERRWGQGDAGGPVREGRGQGGVVV